MTPPGQESTLHTWLRNGLLQEINYPNGVRSTQNYDLADRIETITNTLGTESISSLAYEYDENGNRSEQTESQGGEVETTTYAYDAADRLVAASYPERSVSYVYDGVGNRLEEQEEDPLGNLLTERSYLYDDRHRLETITDLVDPDQSIAYTYDANGNQISRTVASGESLSFLYDHRDRLEEVQRDGFLLERYAYDYQGLRVRKAGPAGVQETTLDDGEPFWRTDGQGLRTSTYHWGPDRLLSLDSFQEGLAYYRQDALGSPTHLLSPEGTLLARQQLDVWGNPRGSTSSFDTANNPLGFTGYEKDATTELLYAKARYYDPKIGRFLTRDPFQGSAQTPPSLHKYLYAHANPTVYVDPTGQCVQGLPCPELVRDTADVIRASTSAVIETSATLAGGLANGVVATADHLTLGTISSTGTRLGTLVGTKGSLSERVEAARVEGNRQMYETATFGFSTAEDKGAHARKIAREAFAVDSFKQGSTLLAEGLVEGDFERGLRGVAALVGAASQVTLTVAVAAEGPLRFKASPKRPTAIVEDAAGPGMREKVLANIAESRAARENSHFSLRRNEGIPGIRPANRLSEGRIAGDDVSRGIDGYGGWRKLDETKDPAVVKQVSAVACGPACAVMLLRSDGLDAFQSSVALRQGSVLTSNIKHLSAAMNRLSDGRWHGEFLDVSDDPRGAFGYLANQGSFATSIRVPGMRVSHLVVIDGLDDAGRVAIRDPLGSSYKMSWGDFVEVWEGQTVYRTTRE